MSSNGMYPYFTRPIWKVKKCTIKTDTWVPSNLVGYEGCNCPISVPIAITCVQITENPALCAYDHETLEKVEIRFGFALLPRTTTAITTKCGNMVY